MSNITSRKDFTPPTLYALFFLYIEPFSALIGAYFALFEQENYLHLTQSPTSSVFSSSLLNRLDIPKATQISLTQLSNLYFLFSLNEALVLRCTHDIQVWRTLLFCLLVADFGHLYSCFPLFDEGIYWRFWEWNAMAWGNVGFVYAGASMRIAFLTGVGMSSDAGSRKRRMD